VPFPSGSYVDQLRSQQGAAATEFDHLYGQLEGYLRKDHKDNGSHGDIHQHGRTVANGVYTDVLFSAAHFTASGSMTWTVAAGDQTTYAYMFSMDRLLTVTAYIVTSTIGGTPDNQLRVAIPGGFAAAKTMGVGCLVGDNGATVAGFAYVEAAGTHIKVIRHDGANYSASAGNAGVRFTIEFPVQDR
jgi:hypothetical protein